MNAASIVNEAYCVEQRKRLRKQLKPIAFILIECVYHTPHKNAVFNLASMYW